MKSRIIIIITTIAPFFLIPFSGNAFAEGWGSGATFTPGWARIRQSFEEAVVHPMTWGPALAGVVVAVSGRDEELARALYENPPLFGTRRKADRASDRYREITDTMWMVSMLATESGDEPVGNKLKGALVQCAAVNATYTVTNITKSIIERDEPIPTDGESFPSNHATGAFAHATLIRENMKRTWFPASVAWAYTAAAYVAATGAAWGRAEAGGHYLSDQLLSAAVGNVTALFINSAFMGDTASVGVHALHGMSFLTITIPF